MRVLAPYLAQGCWPAGHAKVAARAPSSPSSRKPAGDSRVQRRSIASALGMAADDSALRTALDQANAVALRQVQARLELGAV